MPTTAHVILRSSPSDTSIGFSGVKATSIKKGAMVKSPESDETDVFKFVLTVRRTMYPDV